MYVLAYAFIKNGPIYASRILIGRTSVESHEPTVESREATRLLATHLFVNIVRIYFCLFRGIFSTNKLFSALLFIILDLFVAPFLIFSPFFSFLLILIFTRFLLQIKSLFSELFSISHVSIKNLTTTIL